jgi:uncharacterized OB-fold protein
MSEATRDPTPDRSPRIQPPVTEGAEGFWEATRERRYVLQWCLDCEQPVSYPRVVCPGCLGTRLEHRPASGRGTVYAVTVEHRPQNPSMRSLAPYAVALVDLEEGVRVLSNVVDCAPDDVSVGLAVAVTWEPLDDGRNLPLFRPYT